MGIGLPSLDILLRTRATSGPLGRTLQIGRQGLYVEEHQRETADAMVRRSGLASTLLEIAGESHFADDKLFPSLGSNPVLAADASPYQGASVIWDFNTPVPTTLHENFDTIFDGGSLEHIFNVPVAISNMMQMLAVGGRLISALPANNWLGHGFYQFGPEFPFRVFQRENGFRVVGVYLTGLDGTPALTEMKDRGAEGARNEMGPMSVGSDLIFVAEKISAVTPFRRWPQQGDYQAEWDRDEADRGAVEAVA